MNLYDVVFIPTIGRRGSPLTAILALVILAVVVVAAVVLVRRKQRKEVGNAPAPKAAQPPKDPKDEEK